MFSLLISSWKFGGIWVRVAEEQSGPCAPQLFPFDLRSCGPLGWLGMSDLGETEQAVTEKNRPVCLYHICRLLFCVSFSSFTLISARSFLLEHGTQVGKGRAAIGQFKCKETPLTLLADIFKPTLTMYTLYLFIYLFFAHFISVRESRCKAPVTTQTVTLLVLRSHRCGHDEGHLLSPSGPCEYLKVLSFHIQQRIQRAFVSERFVPLVLTNKIIHSTKGYMPHFIDCSQKYFQSCKSWQGRNQIEEKEMRGSPVQRRS